MLRRMLTIRRFEERASDDYVAGKIYGVVPCYISEEAVAVGVRSALDRIAKGRRRISATASASSMAPTSTAMPV